MNAVILAAGRGSRMLRLTADRPKCLVEIFGRPLLHWQLDALRAAGADAITVVGGYRHDMLAGDFAKLANPHWATSNMVVSLLQADALLLQGPCIVSYSDIAYRPEHVRALSQAPDGVAICYDTLWESLWRLRFGNPLNDAETFREEDGLLADIGGRPDSLAEVRGQYMGLLRLTPEGWREIRATVERLAPEALDRLDMTAMLRLLLERQAPVHAIPVAGGWIEVDSEADLEAYGRAAADAAATGATWSHDFRTDANPQRPWRMPQP